MYLEKQFSRSLACFLFENEWPASFPASSNLLWRSAIHNHTQRALTLENTPSLLHSLSDALQQILCTNQVILAPYSVYFSANKAEVLCFDGHLVRDRATR